MEFCIEILLTFLLATNLMFAVASRLLHCIKLAALQGIILGVLPLLAMSAGTHGSELIVMTVLNIGIKGIVLPLLLVHALKLAQVKREVEPFIGYSFSLVILLLAMAASFWISGKITLPQQTLSSFALPAAFTTVFTGVFLIITRRKALTQAIGFLVFENGIGLFGLGLMIRHGFIVELGILLDVVVLIFVMGIALFQIKHEFQHIDTDKLNQLGDVDAEETGAEK